MKKDLESHKGKPMVLDTRSSWIYLGTLEKVTEDCAVLKDADVHDSSDSSTSKEVYIFESRTTGIKPNRNRVHVSLDQVISFSLLKDVKQF